MYGQVKKNLDTEKVKRAYSSYLNRLDDLSRKGTKITYLKNNAIQAHYRGAFFFFHYLFNYDFYCCNDYLYELSSIKFYRIRKDVKKLRNRQPRFTKGLTFNQMCETLSDDFFRCQNDTLVYIELRGL